MFEKTYPYLTSDVQSELEAVESLLRREMSKGNSRVSREAVRLLEGGGKRIRPLLMILFARLGDHYQFEKVLPAAASIEAMHMATLVHDDTIDNADQRRGIETTFKKHGIHTAVYTGDWILVKSLQFLSSGNSDFSLQSTQLNLLANSMESVCNGEIEQYFGRGSIPSKFHYYSRIKEKTAALFIASCVFGIHATELDQQHKKLAADFGEHFGIAFQIQDDILDIFSSSQDAGKPVKNDLREGIITLPVIYACQHSSTFRRKVLQYLNAPEQELLFDILQETRESKGMETATEDCRKHVRSCYSILSEFSAVPAVEDLSSLISHIFLPIK
jgi:heptaprenyl diphosphate synthase